MGFGSLFSKEGRKERSLARLGKTVLNLKAAGEDRWDALLQLAKERTDPAIHHMLCRFTYTTDVGSRSRVTDEQEKRLVYDLLVEMGERALPEVSRFLVSEEGPPGAPKHSISYALRILDNVVPTWEDAWTAIEAAIEANEPGYERDPSRKIELVVFLGEWQADERVSEAIEAYLEDADEGVRFHTAEALLKLGHERCKPILLAILEEDDESFQMRNRVLAGFIDNGWLADVTPFFSDLDEPGLYHAAESLVRLTDAPEVRDALVRVAESKRASERIRSRAAEWYALAGATTHGMRGRLEKVLPKGYKVTKKHVERFPDAMREPYLSLAIEGLLERDEAAICYSPLARMLRNRELGDAPYVRVVEFLATRGWSDPELIKILKKVLPKGYEVTEEGVVLRNIAKMDEPFLTAAGDNLMDHAADDDEGDEEAVRQELIQVIINANADERVRDRILDRFAREEWSVAGYDVEIERRLSREFVLNSVDHGRDVLIVRVLARI